MEYLKVHLKLFSCLFSQYNILLKQVTLYKYYATLLCKSRVNASTQIFSLQGSRYVSLEGFIFRNLFQNIYTYYTLLMFYVQ